MKTPHRSRLLPAFLCLLFSVLTCSSALATLPVISAGETAVFSDDFTNNSTGWSNVAVSPTTGKIAIDNSLWSPSIAGDKQDLISSATLPQAVNINDGSISLYLRARTDGLTSTDNGRFSFSLTESTGNRFFGVNIRPNAATQVEYRNASGAKVFTNLSSAIFANTSTFYDFKITLNLVDDSVGNLASAEVFVYNTTSSTYTSLGIASSVIDLDTGVFNLLTLYARNSETGAGLANGGAYIDSVAITQMSTIPEPGTSALIFGSIFLSLGLTARPRRR